LPLLLRQNTTAFLLCLKPAEFDENWDSAPSDAKKTEETEMPDAAPPSSHKRKAGDDSDSASAPKREKQLPAEDGKAEAKTDTVAAVVSSGKTVSLAAHQVKDLAACAPNPALELARRDKVMSLRNYYARLCRSWAGSGLQRNRSTVGFSSAIPRSPQVLLPLLPLPLLLEPKRQLVLTL